MRTALFRVSVLGLIAGLALLGVWGATQYAAYWLAFADELGSPWLTVWGVPIYPPWSVLIWDYQYGASFPTVFQKAAFFSYGGTFAGVLAAVVASAVHSRERKDAVTFGSARWASRKDVKSAGLLQGKGVVIGTTSDRYYLRHDGPEHIKVIAPTRSGKGVGVVIPTLLAWPHSTLVYDLKSENWNATAGYRSRFSRTVCFSPGEQSSAHFNPLLEVRLGDFEVRDVQNIADMIVDPEGKGLSDHWAKTGHSLLVGTILHVLYTTEHRTLAGVADFLSNPERDLVQTLNSMMAAKHRDGRTHPVVTAAARDMLNKSDNERSGVLSTAMSFLSLYRDPIVARNTSSSDFRIVELVQSDRPVSLYLVIPPSDINRLRPLFRLMINQICRRLTEELNSKGNRQRLLLLLDEFPALGRLDFFESALGVLAGYGIKAMLISQSTNQLDKTYGAKNSIIDNTHVRVFYAPNTIETAETISRMLGQKTQTREQRNYAGHRFSPWLEHVSVANHESARPLMTPGEVMELPESEELVFVTGRPPIRARKIRYYEDENFKKRLLPPPGKRPCAMQPAPAASSSKGAPPYDPTEELP